MRIAQTCLLLYLFLCGSCSSVVTEEPEKNVTEAINLLHRLSNSPKGRKTHSIGSLSDTALPLPELIHTALDQLTVAANTHRNKEALFTLAEIYLYGKLGVSQNISTALKYYSLLANDFGNATAHSRLAFMYTEGIGVKTDIPKSIIHYSFAYFGGDRLAALTLGYRYLLGINVPKSCEEAVVRYRYVADSVSNSPLVVRTINQVSLEQEDMESCKWCLFSDISFLSKVWKVQSINEHQNLKDVLEYYREHNPDKGYGAQLNLAQLHYVGSQLVERNIELAYQLFRQVYEKGDDKSKAMAAGWLGEMYFNGDLRSSDPNVKPDQWKEHCIKKAYQLWTESILYVSSVAANGLGVMHRDGIYVAKDVMRANQYFKVAAQQGYAHAQYNLGLYHLFESGQYMEAYSQLSAAAAQGHLMAIYYLAYMHLRGLGVPPSCNTAVALYKRAIERSEWLNNLLRDAHEDYEQPDRERQALLKYWMLAEAGLEIAQVNTAYLFEHGFSPVSIHNTTVLKEDNYAKALVQYERAASRGNGEARVKLGDYYYYGWATNSNHKAAAGYYQAAELSGSARAMFNLGYMYENGLGVEKDFPLAKRYYDSCATTAQECKIAAKLALFKLNLKTCSKQFSEMWTALKKNGKNTYHFVFSSWNNFAITFCITLFAILLGIRIQL